MNIEITLDQLKTLLNQQKQIVVEKLSGSTFYYNQESTEGHSKSLPIDKDKFAELGLRADYPNDINVLDKYIKS